MVDLRPHSSYKLQKQCRTAFQFLYAGHYFSCYQSFYITAHPICSACIRIKLDEPISPLFKIDGTQRKFLNGIFLKIIEEQKSDYQYKDELIHAYIQLILHEALKLQPSENFHRNQNASESIISITSSPYS